jgi:hypothetical protein
MSGTEVDAFFDQFVFSFIAGDIDRELVVARGGGDAGNFLSALGLLCYTELLGGVQRGTLAKGESEKNFDSFFRTLGPAYRALQDSGLDVYRVFRCGMVHEYFVKGETTVVMLKGVEPCGIAVDQVTGRYYFVVERYFEDFLRAARAVRDDLLASPNPMLPPELAGRIL